MIARLLLVGLAIAAATAPMPRAVIEQQYSSGLYLRVQNVVTPVSNLAPFALLDLAVALLLVAGLWALVRRWRRRGAVRAIVRTLLSAVVLTAVLYLVFLVMWGLNYRRVPLEQKLAFDPRRLTREAVVRLANDAALRLNQGHAAAHAQRPDEAALTRAFADVQLALGAPRVAATGAPKRSLLTLYFRAAGFDGMTDPVFLEIIVNPDLLPVERPFVVAHEWAHLAGYAHESEANFVAWLTCLRGNALMSYSAWLSAYHYAAAALPHAERKALVPLAEGPRADFAAIAERLRQAAPVVRDAARNAYNSYLRANRVEEGIESYDAVLRLMLGAPLDARWTPALRTTSSPRRPGL